MGIACGASALGFVSAMPSGPGVISEETIAHIARRVSTRGYRACACTPPRFRRHNIGGKAPRRDQAHS
jgi:hypothetical protein